MMIRKQQNPTPATNESGFTLIESLLAIIVVSILMVAVSPIIVFSVATRVQAKRVEWGAQAARAYINGVRGETIDVPADTVLINEGSGGTYTFDRGTFSSVSAPSSLPSCGSPTDGYCQNDATVSLYCVDRDGGGCTSDSNQDVVVQAFRSVYEANNTLVTDPEKGYLLGVRVYRADAFADSEPQKTTHPGDSQPQEDSQSTTFTGGLGDRNAPLVEMTTAISGSETTYQDYCDRFGGPGCN